MQLPEQLSTLLAELTVALDEPGVDLGSALDALIAELTEAIPSFLGLSLTLRAPGGPVTVATFNGSSPPGAQSSLALPIDLARPRAPLPRAVFYAAAPGVFTDLATGVRERFGLDGQVRLDDDLSDPTKDGRTIGDARAMSRALGALLDQGHPLSDAEAELQLRALSTGRTVIETAHAILDELSKAAAAAADAPEAPDADDD